MILEHTFNNWGIEFVGSDNGLSALNLLERSKPFNLIIVDYHMKGEMEKCREAGMDDFLSKPIDQQALRTLLKKYLGNGSSKSELKYKN